METHKVMTSNISVVQKVFNYDKWKLEVDIIKRDTELFNCENRVHQKQIKHEKLTEMLAEKKQFFKQIKEKKELQKILLFQKRAEYESLCAKNDETATRIAQLSMGKVQEEEKI